MKKIYTSRANWLRAAVLGANDGIISTTSLVIGIAAAHSGRGAIVLAALAGLVAGACSMAAGEYVSVSSQTDIEKADIGRVKEALEKDPARERHHLASIYMRRGLNSRLAEQVAAEYSEKDALEAHTRDELGINEMTRPRPLQAAFASAASFVAGGLLPLLVATCAPLKYMILCQYVSAIVFLALSGACAAAAGGCRPWRLVMRICLWGTVAMAFTALVGYIFGVAH